MSMMGNEFAGGRVERGVSKGVTAGDESSRTAEGRESVRASEAVVGGFLGRGELERELDERLERMGAETATLGEPEFADLLYDAMSEAFKAIETTLSGDDFTAQRLAQILAKGEVDDDRTALLLAVLQYDGPLNGKVFLRIAEELGHDVAQAQAIREELAAAGDVAVEAVSGVPDGVLDAIEGPESELGTALLDAVSDLDEPLEPEGWVSLSPGEAEGAPEGLPAVPGAAAAVLAPAAPLTPVEAPVGAAVAAPTVAAAEVAS